MIFGVALSIATAGSAMAWVSPAPDVVLYCSPAMQTVLQRVADKYTAATGVPVHLFIAPPDGLLGLLRHRARADVVVADAPTIATLAAGKVVQPESLVALGNDPFVLIGKTGSVEKASAMQLIASHKTVLPDATTAGSFDGVTVLHAALPDAAAPSTIGVADTPDVISIVGHDAAVIGLVHRTEVAGTRVHEVADLPIAPTPTSGALVTLGQSGNAAPLLAFIAGPEGTAILHQAGIVPDSASPKVSP